MRRVYRDSGYQEVLRRRSSTSLWKKSGHWDNFKDNMFFTGSEKRTYAEADELPGHADVQPGPAQLSRPADPLRRSSGACHRNEPSGALHGILRVRGFTQDDGHILCTEDQIEAERRHFTRRR